MKILFIAPSYFPNIGGVEKHIYNVCNEMLKDNHCITILTINYKNTYAGNEVIDGLKVVRVANTESKIINRLYMIKYMFLNVKKILSNDVVHFHDYTTFWNWGLFVYPILKLFGKKMFITFHGWEGVVPPKKSIVLKRKVIEKLLDGNICIGHYIKKWYGTNSNIVSYGGANKVSDLSKSTENYILYIGRLAEDTGVYGYIKAFNIFSKKNKNIKLIICGDGGLRKGLEKYIIDNNVENILFKGFVLNVGEYLKDAKIVFTSGYLGILEAFSYKKNVISVYDNELKKDYLEMIPDCENMMWVVENVEGIVAALDEAMVNVEKREVAYRFLLENSWGNVKKDYYKLWKEKLV